MAIIYPEEPPEPHTLTDWELWACARHQITQHGEEAATVAAFNADRMLDAGDLRGQRVWVDILARIRHLTEALPDDTRH
ncbi:MAG: hypothetical protein ACK5SX_09020 [Sandaracinobacter sp.]